MITWSKTWFSASLATATAAVLIDGSAIQVLLPVLKKFEMNKWFIKPTVLKLKINVSVLLVVWCKRYHYYFISITVIRKYLMLSNWHTAYKKVWWIICRNVGDKFNLSVNARNGLFMSSIPSFIFTGASRHFCRAIFGFSKINHVICFGIIRTHSGIITNIAPFRLQYVSQYVPLFPF